MGPQDGALGDPIWDFPIYDLEYNTKKTHLFILSNCFSYLIYFGHLYILHNPVWAVLFP